MNREFIVKEIFQEKWNKLYGDVRHANMNQSIEYGLSKSITEGWEPIWFIMEYTNGNAAAIVQVLTKKIPLLGKIARVSRGPLLVNKEWTLDEPSLVVKLLSVFIEHVEKYRWLVLSVSPEIRLSNDLVSTFRSIGLYQRNLVPYGSSLVQLNRLENDIFMDIKGKWRNLLRKSQKSNIFIRHRVGGSDDIKRLIDEYEYFKIKKRFIGERASLLNALSMQESINWKFNIYTASILNKDKTETNIGTVFVVKHGDTATYLVGYTFDDGRKLNANYLLLWSAIIGSKKDGCKWFDMGGLNKTTPKGIAHFKRGLNANEYILQGEMLYSRFPVVANMIINIENILLKTRDLFH